nr:CKLF-like MARVEL transmembrane domain-containing protein 3 isoform X2 [Chelonoidis abingdonii]
MYQEVGVWGRRDGTEGWGWGTNLGCLPAPRRRLSAAGQRRAEGGGARSGHSPHLQLLNFFTFPQCHDFRFPPLKKKNPSPQAFSSSPSRPVEPRSAPLPAMDLPASEDPDAQAPPPALRTLLPSRDFLCSRKGQLLLAESVLSFITFICYIASSAASFMMAPLIEFLVALFLFFAYSSKLNEKFKGIYWPLSDFLRCVTAAIIYFAISIAAVSKYSDGASKAAGMRPPIRIRTEEQRTYGL